MKAMFDREAALTLLKMGMSMYAEGLCDDIDLALCYEAYKQYPDMRKGYGLGYFIGPILENERLKDTDGPRAEEEKR